MAATTCSKSRPVIFKGPAFTTPAAIPLHADNETIVKERISLDKADRNILHDEITTIDHALTRPWTVTKNYRRDPIRAALAQYVCAEGNPHLRSARRIISSAPMAT